MSITTNEFIEKYIPKKYRESIEDVSRDIDGYWVTLKAGYVSTATETRTIHEFTIADVKKQFKTIELSEEETFEVSEENNEEATEADEASEVFEPGEQITLLDTRDFIEEIDNEFETDMALLNEDISQLIRRSNRRNDLHSTKPKIVIAGTLGLWNNSPFGYFEQHYGNINLFLSEYDTVVNVEKDGTIEIKYDHHDGTHYMNIYTLPDNVDISKLSVREIEKILSKSVALRIDNQLASDYVIRKAVYTNV